MGQKKSRKSESVRLKGGGHHIELSRFILGKFTDKIDTGLFSGTDFSVLSVTFG